MALKLKTLKEDVGKMPAIPTLLEFDINRPTSVIKAGWYSVRINSKGIEVLPPTAVNFGTGPDAFDKCLKSCDVHNSYIGMSKKEIAVLYGQRRFSHNQNS
jgi:hypothetical protein